MVKGCVTDMLRRTFRNKGDELLGVVDAICVNSDRLVDGERVLGMLAAHTPWTCPLDLNRDNLGMVIRY